MNSEHQRMSVAIQDITIRFEIGLIAGDLLSLLLTGLKPTASR
jgi:hypothetical protein